MDALGRCRIPGLESFVERTNTKLCRLSLQSFSECRIRSGSFKQPINNRSKVESCTPNEQDPLAPVLDVGNCCVCKGLIVGNGEGLGNVRAVYEVMPCRPLFFRSRFGGANVHLPIDLARIDGDDFGIEALCELNCYLCFANCCGTEETEKF